ncbi:Glycosyl phosphatidyl inositol anchor synthesis [Mycoemilia scoparia]|uniref:GPI ethanolamine phosphate transferase 1 n=1 Tax=Mycoemilia scoparia TaxID=417184 RepID=A0A9W8DNH4_9FUNG|nr:Glycosyl phosphatidyl inositol anchor synthesis [Mycoemilia scoparia]
MTPITIDEPAPAQRLVLFVADGLRADRIFEPRDPTMFSNASSSRSGNNSIYKDDEKTWAPYLMNIIQNHNASSWGVSHTRVPTESRPGHVAVIAGFYEDVSAVTKGWKMNPVEFDSLFNETRHTWSFGSPDILEMFKEGASDRSRVDIEMYSEESEDFQGNAAHLDEWVFDHVHSMFDTAEKENPDHKQRHDEVVRLEKMLRQDKIVLFLHLLGLDTNGHAHLPNSKEYYENIRFVDQGVKKMVERIEKFYGHDGKTSYIFTADHGMGDLGAHGDGHPDNTRTPLIAWGAGIAASNKNKQIVMPGHDDFSKNWDLTNVERKDVRQADIAPLMASLIGVPLPMNSVGTLPLNYLDVSPKFRAKAAFANAKQILAQYQIKHDQKKSTEFHFVPYGPLHRPEKPIQKWIQEIEDAIDGGKYEVAELRCAEFIELCLEGLRYFQRYDWLLLRSIVSAGYIGWIMYSLAFILKTYVVPSTLTAKLVGIHIFDSESKNKNKTITDGSGKRVTGGGIGGDVGSKAATLLNGMGLLVLTIFYWLFYMQKAPLLYYAYLAFPVYFWVEVAKQINWFRVALSSYFSSGQPKWKLPSLVLLYIAMLEAMVYGYFDRSLYSVGLVVMGVGWAVSLPKGFTKSHTGLVASWLFSCFSTAIFTILPVESNMMPNLAFLGGAAITLSGILVFYNRRNFIYPTSYQNPKLVTPMLQNRVIKLDTAILAVQVVLVGITSVLVYITHQYRSSHSAAAAAAAANKNGDNGQDSSSSPPQPSVPVIYRALLWCLLFISSSVPFIQLVRHKRVGVNPHFFHRLVTIYLAFAVPFQILTHSHESWFYLCFSSVLFTWLILERDSYRFEKETIPLNNLNTTKASSTAESKTNTNPYRELCLRDARTALFFLLFISVAFFGTGNVASMASFKLQSVFNLMTVFRPFLMAIILVFKILIPFFLLSSVFGVLNQSLDLPPFSLFLIVLSTTDIMTLNFFFLVRDEGSWLDIGMSISHFCISSLFVLLSIVLFILSHVLVGKVLVPTGASKGLKKKHA